MGNNGHTPLPNSAKNSVDYWNEEDGAKTEAVKERK
jgi:hypothetical protein